MKQKEWDALWWDEFLKLRRQFPTRDLTLLHRASVLYMVKRYGQRPPDDEPGLPLWIKLSQVLGVPMLASVWNFLNGKKMLFGAILVALAVLSDQLGTLLPLFGVEAVLVAKVVGTISLVVGFLHKVYKFYYKEEPPTPKQ